MSRFLFSGRGALRSVAVGLVFVGAIASIHSTAAPYIGTGGTILLRDVYFRYVRKQKSPTDWPTIEQQKGSATITYTYASDDDRLGTPAKGKTD